MIKNERPKTFFGLFYESFFSDARYFALFSYFIDEENERTVRTLEDSKIIDLFFERSEDAISVLSDKYGALCEKLAVGILKNGRDAEECVNDTYLAVWNSIPPERPQRLISYVCRIARNIATAKYHSNTAEKRNSRYDVALDELEDCFASSESVEECCEANETARAINSFLMRLDSAERVMFVKRYFFAESVSDIAEHFGLTPHAVSVKLFRIRERLKKHLEREGIAL